MLAWNVGRVTITRIPELEMPIAYDSAAPFMREATPEAIATHALHLLNDPIRRQQARADLRSVRAFLGDPGASTRTARLVVDLARQGKENR